jgi:hypothetical protein
MGQQPDHGTGNREAGDDRGARRVDRADQLNSKDPRHNAGDAAAGRERDEDQGEAPNRRHPGR